MAKKNNKSNEIGELMELVHRKYVKLRKQLKQIKLIQERSRIRFHHSYPPYSNKINIYESFSNITDAHIKLP